jgi:hypothetical protein
MAADLPREAAAQRMRMLHARLARARRCLDLARDAIACGNRGGRYLRAAAQGDERGARVELLNLHLVRSHAAFAASHAAAAALAFDLAGDHLELALRAAKDAAAILANGDLNV